LLHPGEYAGDKKTRTIDLEEMYCNANTGLDKKSGAISERYDGVAFFIERMNSNPTMHHASKLYDLVIGICDPNRHLKYIGSQSCVGPYELSPLHYPYAAKHTKFNYPGMNLTGNP
jgi:hypothetical protein